MTKGYEFVDGKPVLRPDYDHARLVELAGEPDENGYAEVTVEVKRGETAWNPGSTKHVLYGPTTVRYEFYREGVRGIVLDDVPEATGEDLFPAEADYTEEVGEAVQADGQ